MPKYFEQQNLDAAQYDILFDDLSDNSLMPHHSVSALNKQLITDNKIIVKAINELKSGLNSSENKFESFSSFYNSLLGDVKKDPILQENLLKIDENILKVVYSMYVKLAGNPDDNLSISEIADNVYNAILKLNSDKANLTDIYNKSEVEELIDSIPPELPTYNLDQAKHVLTVNDLGSLEWSKQENNLSGVQLDEYNITVDNSTGTFFVKSFGKGITIFKTDNAKYTIHVPENVSIKSLIAKFDIKEVQNNKMIEFKLDGVNKNIDFMNVPLNKVYNLSNNGVESANVISKISPMSGSFDPNYYTLTNIPSGVELLVSLIW